ncbi:hypothetical protein U14_01250 [Candidatus Moduliflexus flocculans]|uniref:Uncharacterized protein n=1 Tax=Candidatus Moduliflexus flocculans TaxID=1499966 RepID=A0A0S6VWA9_9BACT|nr:hypothetical protein U14_01250 [Candidatus Moduliflexus flocculans]
MTTISLAFPDDVMQHLQAQWSSVARRVLNR